MFTHPLRKISLVAALSLLAAAFAVTALGDDGSFSFAPESAFAQDNDNGVTNLDDSESSVVTPAILYGLLIVAALAAIGAMVIYRQRRRHRPQDDLQDGPLTSVSERDRDADERLHHPR